MAIHPNSAAVVLQAIPKRSRWQNLVNLLVRLTEPHPSLSGDDRFRARILAVLAPFYASLELGFGIFPVFLPAALVNDIYPGFQNELPGSVVSSLFMVGVWILARGRHYKYAVRVFLLFPCLYFSIALLLVGGHDTGKTQTYIIFAFYIVASGILVRIGEAIGYSALVVLLMLAFSTTFLEADAFRTRFEALAIVNLTVTTIIISRNFQNYQREIAARARDLQLAADISRAATTVLDSKALLEQIVERTQQAFELRSVSVYLYDPATQTLRFQEASKNNGQRTDLASLKIQDRDPIAMAACDRQPVLIGDVTQAPGNFAVPRSADICTEFALPMQVGDNLIGILDLQAQEVNRFGASEIQVLTSLSEQLAIAVQNARLYAQQEAVARQLRQADAMKSQFLASMSHELRTPLNGILNFTEFVSEGMYGEINGEQKTALATVYRSGEHLLSLINDILDIAKIEAGAMQLFWEPNIDLNEQVKTVSEAIPALLKDKPVQFALDIDPDLPPVTCDSRRIRQVMLNLLSNAAKFTEKGTITLAVKNEADHILFMVSDTGPGIAPNDAGKIFEPFQQSNTGLKHGSGTGLGLPICRKLVEAHGGKLWLESEPGEGATFFATLPFRTDRAMTADVANPAPTGTI